MIILFFSICTWDYFGATCNMTSAGRDLQSRNKKTWWLMLLKPKAQTGVAEFTSWVCINVFLCLRKTPKNTSPTRVSQLLNQHHLSKAVPVLPPSGEMWYKNDMLREKVLLLYLWLQSRLRGTGNSVVPRDLPGPYTLPLLFVYMGRQVKVKSVTL